jgi:hypothetical protein
VALTRAELTVQDGLGRALAGAQVYWALQPAVTTVNPPSPLAIVYTDLTGGTPETQPIITDGFGYAFTYLDDTVLYTVVIWHPLFGENPLVYPDQAYGGGGGGGGGSNFVPFQGIPIGTIDGTNTVFTLATGSQPLSIAPVQVTVWNNFPRILGLGYTLGPLPGQITYAIAPRPAADGVAGDAIYAEGWLPA